NLAMKNHSVTLLNLSPGVKYMYQIRTETVDGSALSSTYTFTTFAEPPPPDTTPPSIPIVIDVGETTTGITDLHARWSSSDPESGISEYFYAIGTTPNGTDIAGFTSAGLNTSITRSGLSLEIEKTYYITVKAVNGVGLISQGT